MVLNIRLFVNEVQHTFKILIKFVNIISDVIYVYDGYFYSDGEAKNESLNIVLPRL